MRWIQEGSETRTKPAEQFRLIKCLSSCDDLGAFVSAWYPIFFAVPCVPICSDSPSYLTYLKWSTFLSDVICIPACSDLHSYLKWSAFLSAVIRIPICSDPHSCLQWSAFLPAVIWIPACSDLHSRMQWSAFLSAVICNMSHNHRWDDTWPTWTKMASIYVT